MIAMMMRPSVFCIHFA